MKIHDEVFEYEGLNRRPAKATVRAYALGRNGWAQTFVVACSELLEGNPGCSVTNGAEKLASQYFRAREDVRPLTRVLWVEHYPDRGSENNSIPESFDLVTFDWDVVRVGSGFGARAKSPVWHRVSRGWVEELIREEFPR